MPTVFDYIYTEHRILDEFFPNVLLIYYSEAINNLKRNLNLLLSLLEIRLCYIFFFFWLKLVQKLKFLILEAKRNDECIGFTMMCFFFFEGAVYIVTCRNNA